MRGHSHMEETYRQRKSRLDELSAELADLRAAEAADGMAVLSLAEHADRLQRGEREPANAHIRHAPRPASEVQIRAGKVAELWAAVSVGLMLIVLVLVAAYQRDHLIGVLIPSIALFAFVEAGFRGRLTSLLGSVNSALAVVAALVLLYQFFWQAVVTGVVAVGLYILWDNLKEFRR